MRRLLVLGALLLASSPALSGPQPVASKPPKDPGDKVICISETMVGSRLSNRICRKKSEWDAAREAGKRLLDRRNGELRAPTPVGPG